MATEALDTPALWHPLLDVATVSLEQLRARCTDDGAEILACAQRLAAWRRAEEVRIHEHLRVMAAVPFAEAHYHIQETEDAILASDLLRAIAALHSDLLRSPSMDPAFEHSLAQWREQAAALPEPTRPLPLSTALARRCTLYLRHLQTVADRVRGDDDIDADADRQALDPEALLRMLGVESALALYRARHRYIEGLVTADEAIRAHIAERESWVAPMPPGYWDHFGGLAALDEAMSEGRGAWLVGPLGSGRHALAYAWTDRLRYTGVPRPLGRWGCNIDNYLGMSAGPDPSGVPELVPPAALAEQCVFIWTVPTDVFDRDLPRDLLEAVLYFCDANDARFVGIVEPATYRRIRDEYPLTAEAPAIEVEPLRDPALLGLAQLPALIDRWHKPDILAQMCAALGQLTAADLEVEPHELIPLLHELAARSIDAYRVEDGHLRAMNLYQLLVWHTGDLEPLERRPTNESLARWLQHPALAAERMRSPRWWRRALARTRTDGLTPRYQRAVRRVFASEQRCRQLLDWVERLCGDVEP